MSYSVTFDRSYSNRYVVSLSFDGDENTREAVIDTACSTTLVPLHIAEKFGIKHGNKSTVIVGGGTYDAVLYTFDNVLLGDLIINKLSTFAANYAGYLQERVLLGMNVLLNLDIRLKRTKNGVLTFDYEPWWVVCNRKYPCGFFFADGGMRAVYPDLLVDQAIDC